VYVMRATVRRVTKHRTLQQQGCATATRERLGVVTQSAGGCSRGSCARNTCSSATIFAAFSRINQDVKEGLQQLQIKRDVATRLAAARTLTLESSRGTNSSTPSTLSNSQARTAAAVDASPPPTSNTTPSSFPPSSCCSVALAADAASDDRAACGGLLASRTQKDNLRTYEEFGREVARGRV
jgi:hypothetical protein